MDADRAILLSRIVMSLNMSEGARLLYVVLYVQPWQDDRGHVLLVEKEYIMKVAGLTERTLQRRLRELQKVGLVSWTRECSAVAVYTPYTPETWPRSPMTASTRRKYSRTTTMVQETFEEERVYNYPPRQRNDPPDRFRETAKLWTPSVPVPRPNPALIPGISSSTQDFQSQVPARGVCDDNRKLAPKQTTNLSYAPCRLVSSTITNKNNLPSANDKFVASQIPLEPTQVDFLQSSTFSASGTEGTQVPKALEVPPQERYKALEADATEHPRSNRAVSFRKAQEAYHLAEDGQVPWPERGPLAVMGQWFALYAQHQGMPYTPPRWEQAREVYAQASEVLAWEGMRVERMEAGQRAFFKHRKEHFAGIKHWALKTFTTGSVVQQAILLAEGKLGGTKKAGHDATINPRGRRANGVEQLKRDKPQLHAALTAAKEKAVK